MQKCSPYIKKALKQGAIWMGTVDLIVYKIVYQLCWSYYFKIRQLMLKEPYAFSSAPFV
jgi:hypothetical protein